jgi:hypothetical protein
MKSQCTRTIAGCVAENNAKYLGQALRLVQSWRWFAGSLADCPFTVCVVGDKLVSQRDEFEKYGAHMVNVDRFSPLHAPSNKLRFLELPEVANADRVVLLDCDTVVVREPLGLLSAADFAAKPADVPTVSHETFEQLFAFFGLKIPQQSARCSVRGEPTIPYFNAGVLSFSRRAVAELAPVWCEMNRRLIANLELLGKRTNFCEQASLTLALAVSGCSVESLDNKWNFPVHFQKQPPESAFGQTDPAIIHYHWLVDADGFLLESPYNKVNSRIASFNARLRTERVV